MAYERPTLSPLIAQAEADINGRLPGADSRLPRSVLWVLARVWAAGFYVLYGFIDWVKRQLFVTSAERDFLLVHASDWGLTLKPATRSAGLISVTGDIGEMIEEGSQLQRSDGEVFTVDADVILSESPQQIAVTSLNYSARTITAVASELRFISPISGVNTVAVVVAPGLTGGADEEDIEALRARILARIRRPAITGKRGDYEQWALEVSGVTRAWEYPLWMGPNTVGLTFVFDDREDILPGEADIDGMHAHLDERRPVTAEVIVFPPEAEPINFNLSVTPDTPAIRAAVIAEIRDLFAREAEPGGVIALSRINEAISIAEDETDHDLNAPAADAGGTPGALPVVGTFTWV